MECAGPKATLAALLPYVGVGLASKVFKDPLGRVVVAMVVVRQEACGVGALRVTAQGLTGAL